MEVLLHYIWKHKLFPLHPLTTVDGQPIEVIDAGLHNRHQGPDFFNAKVKIGGTLWVGNVEIHDKSSDWYLHGHDKDAAYNNVVLHVTGQNDADVTTANGKQVAQMVLAVPRQVADNYQQLLSTDSYPPCYAVIPQLSQLTVHSWMSSLQAERLEQKTRQIEQRVALQGGSWEYALFVTLARNYGFGVNGDAFEAWAQGLGLNAIAHHRDDLFQIEAMFMGQAGLLDLHTVPERYRQDALSEGYFTRLQREYAYLAHKFGLQPMDAGQWRFLRLRPQNFPHIRISQLAQLYHLHRFQLSTLIECTTVEQLADLLETCVTPYWETHYTFGSTSCKTRKRLSPTSIRLLIINTVVPTLFAYGRHRSNEQLCQRAFDLLEQLPTENNTIVRTWQQCGIVPSSAADSQALLQLKREYCDKRECLRCRIGYEYLRGQQSES